MLIYMQTILSKTKILVLLAQFTIKQLENFMSKPSFNQVISKPSFNQPKHKYQIFYVPLNTSLLPQHSQRTKLQYRNLKSHHFVCKLQHTVKSSCTSATKCTKRLLKETHRPEWWRGERRLGVNAQSGIEAAKS